MPNPTDRKPEGLVLITDTGMRIPIDLRLDHIKDGCRYWEPVIQGDLNRVMPHVVAFDGPPVRRGECIHFTAPGPGWDTFEWAQRVMANSRHVFGFYDNGEGDVAL